MNRRQFFRLAPAFPVATVSASLTLKAEGQPDIEGLDVSVLRLQPGDIVVIKAQEHIGQQTAERIRQAWESTSPQTKAVVLDGGLSIEGVLRGPQ